MAKTIKMCDMPKDIAIQVFMMLNPGKVTYDKTIGALVTDCEPDSLTYPEGWYYGKGSFRNKHMSTTGAYYYVTMFKSNDECWEDSAKYCTLYT